MIVFTGGGGDDALRGFYDANLHMRLHILNSENEHDMDRVISDIDQNLFG